jgi:hypothetical protein
MPAAFALPCRAGAFGFCACFELSICEAVAFCLPRGLRFVYCVTVILPMREALSFAVASLL